MNTSSLKNPLFACCSDLEKEWAPREVKEEDSLHRPLIWSMANIFLIEIGSIPHVMEEGHYIEWICLKSQKGMVMKRLKPGDKPQARFYLDDDIPQSIYFYCNVHGLLFKDIDCCS